MFRYPSHLQDIPGRMVVALLLSLGLGVLAGLMGRWLGLNQVASTVIILVTTFAVGYLWFRSEGS
jgi:hypothetical protein